MEQILTSIYPQSIVKKKGKNSRETHDYYYFDEKKKGIKDWVSVKKAKRRKETTLGKSVCCGVMTDDSRHSSRERESVS